MKNFTKPLKCCLLFLSMVFWTNVQSQSSIIESFDSGTPAGWTDSYANTSSQACAGNSERDNLYSGSSTGNMTSPNQAGISNGTDVTFSIDYKVVNWSAATVPTAAGWGSADLQYSTDDGGTWITAGTIDDSNNHGTNVCQPYSVTIAGADVPAGSDLRFRVSNTWASGDYYFYIDNFVATQVSANPPNCDATLTSNLTDFPIDGTLTWSGATGIPTGYRISIGSSSGGTDIANNVDVMTATSYTPTGLMNGTTYYVTITPYNDNGDAMGCTEQTFETVPPPPANDECANAIVLNCGDAGLSGTTLNATGSSSSSCNGSIGNNVWYTFTGTGDEIALTINSSTAGAEPQIDVYTGADCSSLTCNSAASASGSGSNPVTTSWISVAGTVYYISIGEWISSGPDFDFTIDLTCTVPPMPPANDNCSGAETLVCGAAAISGTTENTIPPDDPVGCASDYGVWYTFTGTGGDVTLTSVAGSGYDHELDIFSTDSDCDGSFTTVRCDDGAGSGGTETHTFTTDAGTTYYVYVAHYSTTSSTTGTFDIALSCACSATPEATGTLGGTCGAGTYTVEVDLTSLGGASAVNITNDVNGSSELSVSALQTYSLTGFSPGDGTVTVTVADANDADCNTTFTVALPSVCPPTCGGKFYDTGGATGNYSSSENESWTICPDNPGDFVTVTFNTFVVEGLGNGSCWDRLRIFDGNSASAPEIGPGAGYCYQSPTDGTNYPGMALNVPITSTDASGCLHFTFTSDSSGEYEGWDADVTCGPASSVCGNDAVILAGAPQTDLTPQCMEGGWLYYGAGGDTYFAIEPFPAGGNTNAFTANVDIFLGAAQQNTAAVCNGAPIDAHFEMGRAWNVDVLTGSIGGTVNCRFYYDLAETTALATEVATFEAANSACTYTSSAGMVWFKNTGAPYAHYSYDATQTVLATTPGVSGGGINYQEFPVTGFSGGSAGITSLPLTVLPVELASFTGKTMSSTNMLEWVTASEENTEWHVIERSKDGRSNWTEVGRTEAKGFSNELISYQLEDTKPMAKSYYRLRSVDFDGYEDLSKVIYLEREIVQFDIVKVYPVPTAKLLNIDFETVEDQQVQISMTDMLGKVITTRPVGAVAGINTATLDLGNLANGVYFVTVNNGQDKITKRVVKN